MSLVSRLSSLVSCCASGGAIRHGHRQYHCPPRRREPASPPPMYPHESCLLSNNTRQTLAPCLVPCWPWPSTLSEISGFLFLLHLPPSAFFLVPSCLSCSAVLRCTVAPTSDLAIAFVSVGLYFSRRPLFANEATCCSSFKTAATLPSATQAPAASVPDRYEPSSPFYSKLPLPVVRMGCGMSTEEKEGKARNEEIENQLKRDKMMQRNEIKMLLLGMLSLKSIPYRLEASDGSGTAESTARNCYSDTCPPASRPIAYGPTQHQVY